MNTGFSFFIETQLEVCTARTDRPVEIAGRVASDFSGGLHTQHATTPSAAIGEDEVDDEVDDEDDEEEEEEKERRRRRRRRRTHGATAYASDCWSSVRLPRRTAPTTAST